MEELEQTAAQLGRLLQLFRGGCVILDEVWWSQCNHSMGASVSEAASSSTRFDLIQHSSTPHSALRAHHSPLTTHH